MRHLHFELQASPRSVVEIYLDRPANVRLLDPANYGRYLRDEPFACHGGAISEAPYDLVIPDGETWHVVIDCDGARVPGVEFAVRRTRGGGRRRALRLDRVEVATPTLGIAGPVPALFGVR